MVLVVQVVVVVLGEVVLHVRAAAVSVVHVHDVRLAVLRVVVQDGGEVGDGRRVRVLVGVGQGVRVRVLEGVREWVRGQGPG